ncbi:MAG: hypothetical protein FWD14_00890 [Treponema sp.]|nr:hypothetical protein [Treponema sp.]
MENENTANGADMEEKTPVEKKKKKFPKAIIRFICILAIITAAWAAFSMIGRVNAAVVIPDSASLRISIHNPISLIEAILTHETLNEVYTVPELAPIVPILNLLHDFDVVNHGFVRIATRGNMEAALLSSEQEDGTFVAAWDLGFFSPLLRILPSLSNFITIPNLYYVQAGSNSRFEFRADDMTLYIGPYRNLIFITDSVKIYESRSSMHSGHDAAFNVIRPSSYDAAIMISNEFIASLLSEQDPGIAALIKNIDFDSKVEAGLSIHQRKIELRLAAPLSSRQESLNRILRQRSTVPGMAERIPADAQYATILSAGTLEELYQTALVFTPELDDALKTADSASRILLGVTLDDLLFSWSGNEFAVFGLEGRPHPVYAIQISDERKRQEVFDRAFRSFVVNENIRLNLDGTRIPRIEVPEFLQSLLRRWNIFIPSPYYIVHRDYLIVSESADALLAAVRAMQRNDVLPRTSEWRNIAGGRSMATSFSLYYSLDISMPFFLRGNTALSGFMSLYRQGLARMSIDRGIVDISLSLVPGSGNGVTLVNGFPIAVGGRPSNTVSGMGRGEEGRVFFTSGGTSVSLSLMDNSTLEISGQGSHWIIPADGVGRRNSVNAWVVTDRGRITLVDNNMEAASGFPVLLGLRLSSPPAAHEGKLYLCDEDGKVHVMDENGNHSVWETVFDAAVRSPPFFLTVSSRNTSNTYAAVYPKSFSGEIWLLDANGRALPNWPAAIAITEDGEDDFGIGFGTPLLFSHGNRVLVAFINQSGQLLVYDESAELVSPFPLKLDGFFFQQPVYDGEYLWLISSNGNFFRVSMDGNVLYQNIPGFSVGMDEGFITVFDSNNSKVPDIFITGEGNALYAFTRNFRSLEGFPLPIWGRPYFIPALGNRKAEIFGMGMSMRLYRYQFK